MHDLQKKILEQYETLQFEGDIHIYQVNTSDDSNCFFYQTRIIAFLQTKTNNKKIKTLKRYLTKHYINLLPFVILR